MYLNMFYDFYSRALCVSLRALCGKTPHTNAGIPVISCPKISKCISCVPS